MRLTSPTTQKLKTNIIGTILTIPLIPVMTAILIALSLLSVVIMGAHLGYCILTGKNND